VFRRLARPLLGLAFLSSGVEALRDIDSRAERARGYGVGQPVTASRALAGTQIGAGLLMTLGKFPRLTALVLAVTVIPEAATGHAFWAEKGEEKAEKRSLFARDLGLLGGLLVAAADTGGRESVPHRARRASRDARKTARKAAHKQAKQASKQVQRIT
jgi:putative oxidoreductase